MKAKDFTKIAKVKDGMDAVCLNDASREEFEKFARAVFRKYKALLPDKAEREFRDEKNAIEAIYRGLNQKVREADTSAYLQALQVVVDDAIRIDTDKAKEPVIVDLSNLDFDRLRAYFEQSRHKHLEFQQLREVAKDKLDHMASENPTRVSFYKKYQEVIEKYNSEKERASIEEAFEALVEFVEGLAQEEKRKIGEGISEESLAIFDLLKKVALSYREREQVKTVARELLDELRSEYLKINHWRESQQLTGQGRSAILNKLYYLPEARYPESELTERRDMVFQFLYERQDLSAA